MNHKTEIKNIFERKSSRTGFWLGDPHEKTWPIFLEESGSENPEEFEKWIDDPCRWMRPDKCYFHPDGMPMFDPYLGMDEKIRNLSEAGCLSECETVGEIEAYPWPNPAYLDFSEFRKEMVRQEGSFILTGLWSCFFHHACDFLGMENLFIKMYTHPEVVDALMDRIVTFYVEANDRFFSETGDLGDAFFFGNDLGSQLDLLISPEAFRRFIMPGVNRLTAVAKKHNKPVLLHSCGSISRVIPDLIEAGVDGLHPIQAKAQGMDADSLIPFKNDLVFVGGIDTQDLLVSGTPGEIRDDVFRVADKLSPNIVISPSHECILPNVPLENITAMRDAVRELNA